MKQDYANMDTAALVAVVDTQLKGATPGKWKWAEVKWMWESNYRITGLEADNHNNVSDVILLKGSSLVMTEGDAAFIANAPALMQTLLYHLRHYESEYGSLSPDCIRKAA